MPASDQTARHVLKRHGIAPALKRSQNTPWKKFIQSHLAVGAGIDFFTVEILTWARAGDPSGEPPRQFGRDHTAPPCSRQTKLDSNNPEAEYVVTSASAGY